MKKQLMKTKISAITNDGRMFCALLLALGSAEVADSDLHECGERCRRWITVFKHKHYSLSNGYFQKHDKALKDALLISNDVRVYTRDGHDYIDCNICTVGASTRKGVRAMGDAVINNAC
jgi:hypothetical protein